jgi:hypothetical protein
MVLRALGRVGQRVRPAGDHPAPPPRLPAEGRRASAAARTPRRRRVRTRSS